MSDLAFTAMLIGCFFALALALRRLEQWFEAHPAKRERQDL